jgi:Type I phosphodiesterase / nucleotide pyrophosphatase
MLRAGPPAPADIAPTAGTRRSDARLASVPPVSAGELVATEADDAPLLPDYAGANVRGIVPALLGPGAWSSLPAWFPEPARHARQAVLLVLDGLGWEQLQTHRSQLPVLSSLAATTLTTVAPTTTATALSSIATGLTPGEHGLIGYRMYVQGEVINVLRWVAAGGDRRRSLPPREVQPFAAFLGADVPVISPAELEHSAFTEAHLRGSRPVGYRAASAIAVEIGRQLRAGERFVYAYYGGVDKTAHERGFGDFYDAELRAADRIVGDILDALVPGSTLLVTADHGQVDVGDRVITPDPELLDMVALQSGEGRFRWWHASRGAAAELLAGAAARYGDVAWVVTREQTLDEGWFGATVAPPVVGRLGDVALVARDPVSFFDPDDAGPFELVCRHGSLTPAEVLVPLLASDPS